MLENHDARLAVLPLFVQAHIYCVPTLDLTFHQQLPRSSQKPCVAPAGSPGIQGAEAEE